MKLRAFTVGLPDLTPEDAVREIEKCGYGGVEWRVTHVPDEVKGEDPTFWGNNLCTLKPTLGEARRARMLCADADLDILGLGTCISVGDVAATEEAMRFAQAAGAPQIRVGVGKPGGSTYAECSPRRERFWPGWKSSLAGDRLQQET